MRQLVTGVLKKADSPDFRVNPGTFDAKERDQRGDAGVAFHLGQQRG
jgi:hypothetical protein